MKQSKGDYEIAYWRRLYGHKGADGFRQMRARSYAGYAAQLVDFSTLGGVGLDVGCGLISVFEFCDRGGQTFACDPLLDEYQKIVPLSPWGGHVIYSKSDPDALGFEDGRFDWLACLNVLDHTASPAALIAEMCRVLRPGGCLYMEVNFDRTLAKPHYELWHESRLQREMDGFRVVRTWSVPNAKAARQHLGFGIFEKEA